jgi:hypothetical protein
MLAFFRCVDAFSGSGSAMRFLHFCRYSAVVFSQHSQLKTSTNRSQKNACSTRTFKIANRGILYFYFALYGSKLILCKRFYLFFMEAALQRHCVCQFLK